MNKKKDITIIEEITKKNNAQGKGRILGVKGPYASAEIVLKDNEEIMIGRDPDLADLILSDPDISRRHCAIRFDMENLKFYVTDFSKNGTFLGDGNRLVKDEPTVLERGSYLYIVNTENIFLLV